MTIYLNVLMCMRSAAELSLNQSSVRLNPQVKELDHPFNAEPAAAAGRCVIMSSVKPFTTSQAAALDYSSSYFVWKLCLI